MGSTCVVPPRVLLLAGAASSVVASTFDLTMWAAPVTVAGATTGDDLAVAILPATGQGVGLVHATAGNGVDYTLWDGAAWSAFAQIHADVTQGVPALMAVGGTAHAVYWGTDFKYYYESFTSGAWAAASPAIVPAGVASLCGPSTGALAPVSAGVSFVFVNGSCSGTVNHLYDSDLAGGTWGATKDIGGTPSFAPTQRPAVTAPGSGPELVAAFVQEAGTQIYTTSRTGGVWSAPALLTNGLTNDPVALAPLAAGGALLAYRGTDGKLYTSMFNGATWSTPAAPFASSVTVASVPAVAKGVGTAVAEMAYVDGTGALWHTRYVGNAWIPAKQVGSGTGFTQVAIGSGP